MKILFEGKILRYNKKMIQILCAKIHPDKGLNRYYGFLTHVERAYISDLETISYALPQLTNDNLSQIISKGKITNGNCIVFKEGIPLEDIHSAIWNKWEGQKNEGSQV